MRLAARRPKTWFERTVSAQVRKALLGRMVPGGGSPEPEWRMTEQRQVG
jgi:hypothetical protein